MPLIGFNSMKDFIITENLESELLRCLEELESLERKLSLQLNTPDYSKSSIVSKLLDRIERLTIGIVQAENQVKDIVNAQSIMEAIKHQNGRHATFLINVMKSHNIASALPYEFQQMLSIAAAATVKEQSCNDYFNNCGSVAPSDAQIIGATLDANCSQNIPGFSLTSGSNALSKTARIHQPNYSGPESTSLKSQRNQAGSSQKQNFQPITEEEFDRIPERIRGRVKLEDLNELYRYLRHRAALKSFEVITPKQIFEAGLNCVGQTGQAKLHCLRWLNLCELTNAGEIKPKF